jgi:hypothetical protein
VHTATGNNHQPERSASITKALLNDIPNMVVGLIGIPTGLAIQKLIEKIAGVYKCSGISARILPGIGMFLLIAAFYGLYTTALALSVGSLDRCSGENDKTWQSLLVRKSYLYIPCTLVLVAIVALVGELYDAQTWGQVNQVLALIIMLGIFISPFLFLGLGVFKDDSHLYSVEFPHILDAFRLATAIVAWLVLPLVLLSP